MVGVNQGGANRIPELLPSSRRKFIITAFLWLSGAEEFLANFVSMLVEEPVQDDRISVIEWSVQPFFLSVLRRSVFLAYCGQRVCSSIRGIY